MGAGYWIMIIIVIVGWIVINQPLITREFKMDSGCEKYDMFGAMNLVATEMCAVKCSDFARGKGTYLLKCAGENDARCICTATIFNLYLKP